MRESVGGKPIGASNLIGGKGNLHHQPTMIFCERFEFERTCWDPKDGELCLSREVGS